jgi:hypothetical protein
MALAHAHTPAVNTDTHTHIHTESKFNPEYIFCPPRAFATFQICCLLVCFVCVNKAAPSRPPVPRLEWADSDSDVNANHDSNRNLAMWIRPLDSESCARGFEGGCCRYT